MTSVLVNNIFTERLQLSPPEYPWAQEQYEISLQNAWSHTEVAMQSDLIHWNSGRLSKLDKQSIAGILRGFTVIEGVVGQHWANLANIFRKPEFQALCRSFSAQEWVHANAYNLLETTLGIAEENWQAFLQDKQAVNKLETYTNYLLLDKVDSPTKLAQGLAIFGGCCEGVSLFGSFALLLSYTNKGLFPGMNQILSWSVRDEDAHSNCAIRLYHDLVSEYPKAKLKQKFIYECFDIAVQLEKNFIKPAFANGDLSSGISEKDAVEFIQHRANTKLKQLGFEPKYDEGTNPIAQWFYPLTGGIPLNDFFAQRANGAAYAAKLTQDFSNLALEFDF